jgi:hypothetical protein
MSASPNTCIVTFVIGRPYEIAFDRYCRKRLETYCRRYNYELRVFDKPIRELPGKKYTWQKLLLPETSLWNDFEHLAYVDADILIARDAPPLPDVPHGKIGGVPDKLPYQMNGGVLLYRPSDLIREAFAEALEDNDPFWEQKALTRVMLHRWMEEPIDPRFNRQFYFKCFSLPGSLFRRQWFYHACHGKTKMPFLHWWLSLTFR